MVGTIEGSVGDSSQITHRRAVVLLAAALSYLALFLRSGITGVPLGYAEGLSTLLIALAALVIGRMENLGVIALAAMALKLLEFGVQSNADTPFLAYPIMAAAMFVALLAQPRPQREW